MTTPQITIATLADLTPDPQNARQHNARNVGMIQRSLEEVGAGRSILLDEASTILAGNATVEAAAAAGLEKVIIVDTDGDTLVAVRRRDLTEQQKVKAALYDNRTAELASWDPGVLTDIAARGDIDVGVMWSPTEWRDVAMADREVDIGAEPAPVDVVPEQFMVLVECASEQDQVAVLARLTAEGYQCRALTS